MITDRNKLNFVTICCCLSLFGTAATIANALTIQQHQLQQQHHQQQQQQQSIKDDAKHQHDAAGAFENARLLSPRMDYNNEWRPVGRGDPLQNDPTYDYSPPALERVRYWAADKEASSEKDAKPEPASANDKHDILLLGVGSEQQRLQRPHKQHAIKNAKGELPLLQPKYTSIRRSYYAHQLPTHLMPPPPMQSLTATGAAAGMMKPSAVAAEYRHNMPPGYAASTSSAMKSANMKHSKPFYTSTATATSPWTHTQAQAQAQMHSHSAAAAATSTTTMMHFNAHSMPYGTYDSHLQESAHYVSYSRPSVMHTSEPYSPNSIRPSQNALKHGSAAAPRKPWLHELLQKELIKPVRPTMPATKYLMGPATKPSYDMFSQNAAGISTTYKPVSFVTPPTTSTTSSMSTRQTTPLPMMAYTSNPIYITTTAIPTTTTTKITTTTPSPFYSATRLLIPETSNLAFRPTVAAMEMTTDALFSHYNQPEKPLVGPMYLIIEGHSKVKTYGKNELDPHQPKIVPIIPKREPIVRVGDPNSEQRGSVATFQVKHLHTITTPMPATTTKAKAATTTTTTTTRPIMKTSGKPATTTTTTTSVRPTMKMTMKPALKATAKPAEKVKEQTKVTTLRPTVTTAKPTTTTRMTTTSARPSSTTARPISTTARPISTTARTINTTHRPTATTTRFTTTAISKTALRSTIATPNASASTTYLTKFPTPSEAQPPTGMQGLLSLLDNIFQDEPIMDMEQNPRAPPLEARIGSNAGTISAEEVNDVAGVTTEPPREVRQVFDYDQLPDTRLKQLLDTNYEDAEAPNGGWFKSAYDDEEYDESMGESIKRFDHEMDYEEEDNDEEETERAEGASRGMRRITKLTAVKGA